MAATQLEVGLVIFPDRRIGMGHVGKTRLDFRNAPIQLVMFELGRILRLPQPPTFILAGLSFFRVLGLADRFGNLVCLPVEILNLLQQRAASGFHRDQRVNIGRDTAVLAVLHYRLDVFNYEFSIKHVINGFE